MYNMHTYINTKRKRKVLLDNRHPFLFPYMIESDLTNWS